MAKMVKPIIALKTQDGSKSKGVPPGPPFPFLSILQPYWLFRFINFTVMWRFYHFTPFAGPSIFTFLMILLPSRPRWHKIPSGAHLHSQGIGETGNAV